MSTTGRRISAGMVGGGYGADIGKTHRNGMRLDDRYSLDSGVFGQNRDGSLRLGGELGVAGDRTYPDYLTMAEAESARPDGVDLVVVATPNDSHFAIARTFLEKGFHVVCEKPLTLSSDQAAELVRLAAERDVILAVPHCYSAYPMVREAARLVRDGVLGKVNFIDVEHASGWNATALELTGNKQAAWRTDPAVGGPASVVGDLGTHAYHLARYITGLQAEQVSAQLKTFVPGRRVYDHATLGVRWAGDVQGRIWASMVATGHNHGLRIRVFGDQGSLEWQHEDPHHLYLQDLVGETRVLTHGMSTLSEESGRLTRVGLGHPEGFLEAFANFYRDLADELDARRFGRQSTIRELSFPTGVDGLLGVQLVEAALASSAADGAWVTAHPSLESAEAHSLAAAGA